MHAAWSRTSVPATSSSSPDKVAAQPARPRFQDFLTNEDEDVNGFNKTGNQRQRGGRGKKNKKNQWQDWQEEKPEVDWDAPSDPRQKTDVVEYRKTAMERHRYNIGLSETVNASHPKTDSLNKSSEEEEVLTGNGVYRPNSLDVVLTTPQCSLARRQIRTLLCPQLSTPPDDLHTAPRQRPLMMLMLTALSSATPPPRTSRTLCRQRRSFCRML
jgi:hypothetical protein